MRRLTNLNYLAALAMAFAAITFVSCFRDEVVRVPDVGVDSNSICFGANVGWADEDEITRGAEARRTLNEGTITSEEGSVSLPLIVTQEDGIRTATPVAETRGAKVTSGDQVGRMRVWATHKNKDGNVSNYFTSANADGGTVADPEQGVDFERNGSGIYTSTPTFMWPGDGSFTFTAVANLPAGIGGTDVGGSFTASLNTAGTAPEKFTYRVPADAEDQHDIMIAKAENVSGSQGSSVPLNFEHIMAAVNFKVGSVVAGTIKSISLTGVYNKGEYLIAKNEWVNLTIEDGGVFAANIGGDRVVGTDGGASSGTQLNSDTATFMMIPQQPTTGAEIEIMFEDGLTGKTHQLRANIQGSVWNMNTTTNYMINIDGDYNLQIVPLDNLLDSHYIITKVEISSEYPKWILSASADDEAAVTVQLEDEVNPMAKQGFWTDKYATRVVDEWGTNADGYQVPKRFHYEFPENAESARGKDYIEGETMVSNKVVYVFVPENVSGKDRTITLKLSDGSNPLFGANKTIMLTQHSVKWLDSGDGNPDNYWGCELLIEGGKVPWGFCWDGVHMDFALVQGGFAPGKEGNIPPGQRTAIEIAMTNTGIDVDKLYNDTTYFVSLQKNKKGLWFIQIDFGKIGNIEIAQNIDDGYQNTYDIYGFDGITSIGSIIDFIVNWGKITDASTGEVVTDDSVIGLKNTLDYAAIYAMKRNRFYLYNETLDGKEFNMPVLDVSKDLNWYLPAKDQFKKMVEWNANWGQQFTFNDLYWTSTSYFAEGSVDNAHSYAYINGVETIAHRNDAYLTMALRRKTHTADVVVKPEDVVVPGGGSNGPEYGDGGNNDNNQGGDIEGNN